MKKNLLMLIFVVSLFSYNSCKKDSKNPSEEDTITSIDKDTQWSGLIGIDGPVHVKDGAKLTIDAGTTVIFLNKNSYILVEQGGKIDAQGTQTNMIVFSSTKKEYGSAGGIILNGKAPINTATGNKDEIAGLSYGGNIADDNSGILRYCRVEFGGNQITDEKEHNGFTFNGVGTGTILENLQAYKCSDDGFEFFGGTVNAKNLVTYGCEDDLFDWTSGYTGTLENLYGEYLPNQLGDDRRGIEADNNSRDENDLPRSNPTLKNVTLIDNSGSAGTGIRLRRGTYAKFENLYIEGFKEAFRVEQVSTQNYFTQSSAFSQVQVKGFTTLVNSSDRAADIEQAISNSNTANGFDIPVWAITSDDKTQAGKYTDEQSIINAGGKII